jgi:drug/metabolite transporter (DMT)-like permease
MFLALVITKEDWMSSFGPSLSIIAALVAMMFYGFADFVPALMVKKHNPVKITAWSFLVSSIIYGVVGLAFFSFPVLSGSDIFLLIVGSFLSAAGLLFFYKGLESGKASIIVPVASSWSILTVLIGVFLLGETLNVFQSIGIPVVIIGTILVSLREGEVPKVRVKGATSGIYYALLAVFSWGFLYAIIGVLSKSVGWLWPIFVTSVGSTVILFLYSRVNKIELSFPRDITTQFGVYAILNAAAFLLYSMSASYGNIAVISPIVAAAPLIVMALAYFILHERLRRNQVLGVVIILIGIIAVAF